MHGVLRACWCVRSIILCLLFDLCRFRLCAAKRSFAPLNTDVKMSPLNEAGRVWSVIYLFGKLAHYQAAAHLDSPQLPDLLIQIFNSFHFLLRLRQAIWLVLWEQQDHNTKAYRRREIMILHFQDFNWSVNNIRAFSVLKWHFSSSSHWLSRLTETESQLYIDVYNYDRFQQACKNPAKRYVVSDLHPSLPGFQRIIRWYYVSCGVPMHDDYFSWSNSDNTWMFRCGTISWSHVSD